MIELIKQLLLARANRPRPTVEEVEVQVWAFVVRSIAFMVMVIAFGTLWLIGFEKQESELAPIDAIFLEILKAIAFMGVGTLGVPTSVAISVRTFSFAEKHRLLALKST